MKKSEYSAQRKHLREKYVRFPLDLKPDVLNEFKAKCKELGTTPTAEIKKFIKSFCDDASPPE